MKIVRVYTGDDGQSHFEDIETSYPIVDATGKKSALEKATGIVFRQTGGDYNLDFHNAPRRQYVINLVGGVEIEVGDGSKRILQAGDVLLAEDTEGQGHISRALNDEPRHSIFVTLD
ncbi:MAG: hypothetical protein O7A69_14435 [SAR324 cluster bacterium]|nr:hypothetical protein [SAR324 cluster bacterium]